MGKKYIKYGGTSHKSSYMPFALNSFKKYIDTKQKKRYCKS